VADGTVVTATVVAAIVVADGTVVATGAAVGGTVEAARAVVVEGDGWKLVDVAAAPDAALEVVGAATGTGGAPHATASTRPSDQATDRATDPIPDQLPERVVNHAPPTRTTAPDT
jgi:hypothetical protein